MRTSLVTAAALLCLAGRVLLPQAPDSARRTWAGRLLGVFDASTGQPLAGVQVRDAFSGTYALTTATGTVRLDYLTYRGSAAVVQLLKLGYEAKTIVVSRGDTVPITEVLEHAAVLAPVVTTERYRLDRDAGQRDGFERRCGAKTVTCFREYDFTARPSATIADFLLEASGITIGACGGDPSRRSQCGKVAMRSSVIPPAYCEPSIFVDGYLWNPHIGPAVDLTPGTPATAPFIPTDLTGIEVYPTSMPRPLRFEGDPFCGAVVIWTK